VTRSISSKLLIVLIAVLAIAACNKSKTSIPLTWRNPGFEDVSFDKLLVIGVAHDEGRRLFEDTFVEALEAKGAEAESSYTLLPQTEQLTKEQILAVVEGGQFDGIVTTRLLSIEKDQEYVPPKSYTVPKVHHGYGYYYDYYVTSYTTVHEPGYFKTDTRFRLETNIFSVATEGLVWSGQSETVNPDSVAEVIESMTAAVAEQLAKEKLIP